MSATSYTAHKYTIDLPVVIGASVTAQVITEAQRATPDDSKNLYVGVNTSAATGTVTIVLQHSLDGGVTWTQAATQAISGTGTTVLTFEYVPSTNDPLFPLYRVAITTAESSGVTVAHLWLSKRY